MTTRGTAASLHERALPDPPRRSAWVHAVTGPALVLGSSQSERQVSTFDVRRDGIEVCRRRSGGGAVLVSPGDTWIDVLVGRDDPLWSDDVTVAFGWLGQVWQRTLAAVGIDETIVHSGPLRNRRAGGVVCFAGTGPGEVVGPDQTKLVGMSQRRTRSIARFQTMAPSRQPLADTLRYLEPAAVSGIDPDTEVGVTVDAAVLTTAFLAELHR